MNGPVNGPVNGALDFGTGFEGSFGGDTARISPQAVMECKICWTVHDPAIGDETRQVEPGTEGAAEAGRIAAEARKMEADFTEIWNGKMRDVPLVNPTLHVQAVGFRPHEGRALGVLVSPWFMNLVLLPAEGEDWSRLSAGAKEIVVFPSGAYEFIHNTREMIGGYKACSLFSPMGDFRTQKRAVDVAGAIMLALFDQENRAQTDRAADIRAAREADIAAEAPAREEDAEARDAVGTMAHAPSRRAVISAGLAPERAGT